MAETYTCPVEECEHPRSRPSRLWRAISETYTQKGWRRKARPGKSPSLRRTSPLLNWLGVSGMDIMRKVSYGVCDKPALR